MIRQITFIIFLIIIIGCSSTYTHIRAKRFNGNVPGFGRINAQDVVIMRAPGKAENGEVIYEISNKFWYNENKDKNNDENKID